MCLRIGTSFLLDIGLATCTHGFRIWRRCGGRCCAIARRCAQCDAIAKHTQIRTVTHANVCGIVGGALQAFDKLAPTHHRFTRIQPNRRCYTDQHGAHILDHEYDKYWTRLVLMVSAIEWARYGENYAHILIPLQHPCIEIVILVE